MRDFKFKEMKLERLNKTKSDLYRYLYRKMFTEKNDLLDILQENMLSGSSDLYVWVTVNDQPVSGVVGPGLLVVAAAASWPALPLSRHLQHRENIQENFPNGFASAAQDLSKLNRGTGSVVDPEFLFQTGSGSGSGSDLFFHTKVNLKQFLTM